MCCTYAHGGQCPLYYPNWDSIRAQSGTNNSRQHLLYYPNWDTFIPIGTIISHWWGYQLAPTSLTMTTTILSQLGPTCKVTLFSQWRYRWGPIREPLVPSLTMILAVLSWLEPYSPNEDTDGGPIREPLVPSLTMILAVLSWLEPYSPNEDTDGVRLRKPLVHNCTCCAYLCQISCQPSCTFACI